MSLCIIAEKMSKGESIFRGEGITVEDEFTNDTFDDEEEGGEGWLEDGDEVREGDMEILLTSNIQVKGEEIEGLEEPYLLLLPPDPESDTEQPPPSRSLQNRVIHIQVERTIPAVKRQDLNILYIQASPDSAKPAISGLRSSGQQSVSNSRQELKTVFICPELHCKLRLPTQV